MNRVIVLRFVRALAATLVASLAAFLVGPEALGFIPEGYQFIVVGFLAPALLALEKFIRDGGDSEQ